MNSLVISFPSCSPSSEKESLMSRFRKLTHALWHCQYHIVWTPKYRYRVLTGAIKEEVDRCIRAFSEYKKCEIVELNVHWPYTHHRNGSTKGIHFGVCGDGQREDCYPSIQPVSWTQRTEVLWQSFLGAGLLYWYGRVGRGDDTEICHLPGATRKEIRTSTTLIFRVGNNLLCPLWR